MTKAFLISLLEHVLSVFVFTFAATLAVGGSVLTASLGHKALVAGVAAVIQLVLSTFVGSQVGNPNSASLFPVKPSPVSVVAVKLEPAPPSLNAAEVQQITDEMAQKLLTALTVGVPAPVLLHRRL